MAIGTVLLCMDTSKWLVYSPSVRVHRHTVAYEICLQYVSVVFMCILGSVLFKAIATITYYAITMVGLRQARLMQHECRRTAYSI